MNAESKMPPELNIHFGIASLLAGCGMAAREVYLGPMSIPEYSSGPNIRIAGAIAIVAGVWFTVDYLRRSRAFSSTALTPVLCCLAAALCARAFLVEYTGFYLPRTITLLAFGALFLIAHIIHIKATKENYHHSPQATDNPPEE